VEATAVSHERGIAQHAEVDEQHRTGERLDQVMADRHRGDGGFADAAGADDSDEAVAVSWVET
jgi:hypothetical protein